MKLKEIAAMCKKDKKIVVRNISNSDGVVTQWIGTWSALYRISGLPYLSETAIYKIFDIPDDKTCEYGYAASTICPEDEEYKLFVDFAPGDAESLNDLTKSVIDIHYAPYTYILFCYEQRYIFIRAEFLKPAWALESESYFKRYSAVAVKQGMLIEGLIFPVLAWNEDKIRNGIRGIANCLEAEKREKDIETLTESSGKVMNLFNRVMDLPPEQQQIVINMTQAITSRGAEDEGEN